MSPNAPDPDYPIGALADRDPARTRPPGPTETHPRETLECTIDGGWYRTALPGETPTGGVTIPWDGETVSYGLVRREPGTPTPAQIRAEDIEREQREVARARRMLADAQETARQLADYLIERQARLHALQGTAIQAGDFRPDGPA